MCKQKNSCKHIVKNNIKQHKNYQASWWHEGGIATSAMSMICCSMWRNEIWRDRCVDSSCWVAVPHLFRSTVGGSARVVGRNRNVVGWDITKGAHRRGILATERSQRVFHSQLVPRGADSPQYSNIGAHFEVLPEERGDRRRRFKAISFVVAKSRSKSFVKDRLEPIVQQTMLFQSP